MNTQSVTLARLDREKLAQLQKTEDELEVILVAFEKLVSLADLSSEQLDRVQKLEQELGITLLAYQ